MNDSTLIGDMLHHKGRLIDMRIDGSGVVTSREILFAGYGGLIALLAANDITATEQASGALRLTSADASVVTHDLWGITSSLLQQHPGSHVSANLKTGFTLNNVYPDLDIGPMIEAERLIQHNYVSSETGGIPNYTTVDLDFRELVWNKQNSAGRPFPVHEMTVGDLLTLDVFGDPGVPGQDSGFGTYTDRALVLTPFGLTVKFNLRVPLTRLFPGQGNVTPGLGGWTGGFPFVAVDGHTLIIPFASRFGVYGWASEATPLFLSPRRRRILAWPENRDVITPLEVGFDTDTEPAHPNVISTPISADGSDYRVEPLTAATKAAERTEVAILTVLANPPINTLGAHDFPLRDNPDPAVDFLGSQAAGTYGADRAALMAGDKSAMTLRVSGLYEHYNSIAHAVNILKKCRPYAFHQHLFKSAGGSLFKVLPNDVGPFGNPLDPNNPYLTIRPRNHYCTVASGDNVHAWAIANGVPVKTASDLPDSLLDLDLVEALSGGIQWEAEEKWTITSKTGSPGAWHYEADILYDSFTFLSDSSAGLGASCYDLLDVDPDYLWLTVEDVMTAAAALGLPFYLERLVVPKQLEAVTVTRAGQLWAELDSGTVEFDSATDYTVGQVVSQGIVTGGATYNRRRAAFMDAETDVEGEWISDPALTNTPTVGLTSNPILVNKPVGDVLTVRGNPFGVALVFDEMIADPWYKKNLPQLSLWRAGQGGCLRLLAQSLISAGLSRNSRLVLTNVDHFAHTSTDFSAQSIANAALRWTYGAQALPVQATQISAGASSVALDSEEIFLAAEEVDNPRAVVLYSGWPKAL